MSNKKAFQIGNLPRLIDSVTYPFPYLYTRRSLSLTHFGLMSTLVSIGHFIIGNMLGRVVLLFAVGAFLVTVFGSFFRLRKIQPDGFKWRTLRNELAFAAINLAITVFLLGGMIGFLTRHGYIRFDTTHASAWVIAGQYALYWLGFDTYFYWLHRWMHLEPFYSWIHKLHHRSTSPNLLTTLSVSPLESFINGGFVPLFTALLTIHSSTFALIAPTNIIMGLYVHCGYEFLPRWWNRSWLTRWFITATFHDQHHKYFKWNFGGYTPIWDFLCGTARPKYLAEFDAIKARLSPAGSPALNGALSGE